MKRSRNVTVTAVMVTTSLAVAACDVDDRSSNRYDNFANGWSSTRTGASSSFNYNDEKKMRVTCDKPEDFSAKDCHRPNNYRSERQSSGFVFIHYPWLYSSPSYHGSNYGPNTSTARSYSSARSAVTSPGLSGMYRASSVSPATAARFGSMGSTMASRSINASITRGGFGATGRGFAASAAHGSVSAAS